MKELILGSVGLQGVESSVARFLARQGTGGMITRLMASVLASGRVKSLSQRRPELTTISCLNSATVVEFLRHAVHLAGYADEDAGMNAGANGQIDGRNFPWWDNSLWLPDDLDKPGGLADDPTFFIGSAPRLIIELDAMKASSSLRLGDVPPGYVEMRRDYHAFAASDDDLGLTLDDCVRWVWLALRDGAEIAVAQDVPMWLGP